MAAAAMALGRPLRASHPPTGAITIRQTATDRFELLFAPPTPRPVRVLQITDTHFGNPKPEYREKDQRTCRTITGLIETHRPDLIVHTGDFVNNDNKDCTWDGLDFMNALPVPWCHTLGNHDVDPENGSLPVEEYRKRMRNAAFGYFDRNGRRYYAYRLDLIPKGQSKPAYGIFCFDSGYAKNAKHVSDEQLEWFAGQMASDRRANITCPLLAMLHIPTVEFKRLRESGKYTGRADEEVCCETDTGRTFEAFKKSRRIRAVFCGHDHVNDFCGMWDGIELVYGRWTGWGGYGEGERGGRLIEIDPATGAYRHRIVYPRG